MFADLQCGDPARALAAVEHAMRAFVPVSAGTPLSGWPAGFWSLLLAQPALSGGEGGAPELASLGSGPRGALLLRLVGGLDFPHAAQVLGVAEATYRFALQRALQQLGEAEVSFAALGRLRERLHRQVKTLDEARVAELAALRARVLAGEPAPAPAVAPEPSPWLRRIAWAGLVALGLAFAATWWQPAAPLPPGAVQDLPEDRGTPGAARSGPTDADAGRIIHPDYAALAVPAADALNPVGHGLQLIDHLTHNVHRGRMAEWAGFYERLFNFREVRYFDFEGQQTGIKSKAMTSPCGKIRIPINEEGTEKAGQVQEYLDRYHGEGIQHIALSSGNLYDSVDALQMAGVKLLETSETYYELLPKRIPNHGEDLEALKARNILVDGAPGELLLQIFSENQLGPIFFEFIQRKGNEGFGEGNFKALFETIELDQVRRGVLQA